LPIKVSIEHPFQKDIGGEPTVSGFPLNLFMLSVYRRIEGCQTALILGDEATAPILSH